MCRLALINKNIKDIKLLTELFTKLNDSMGGDGLGLGWFENGMPTITKGVKFSPIEAAQKVCSITSDNGIMFHCRRASVGPIDDINCHPYIFDKEITMHNGHLEGSSVLKLMMLENLDKYSADGWTMEKLSHSTDSEIMAYFIHKRGFEIVSLLNCGTVITNYPEQTLLHAGNDLEAIDVNGAWIFASEFPDQMAMNSNQWLLFEKGAEIIVKPTGECVITKGYCVDGKKAYLLKKANAKKNKKNKGKEETMEVA
jgi:predicted glutamine amidotransferase